MSNRVIPISLRAHARLIESKRKRDKKATKTTGAPGAVWYEEESRTELVLIYRIKTIEKEAGGIGQKLHFGAYQVRFQEELISEGLFYPDDLTPPDYNELEEYARTQKAGATRDRIPLPFHLLKQADFIRLFMYIGHTFQGMITSHDIPFSVSILASGVNEIKRGFYAGGLNFYFKTYPDGKKRKADLYGPRISIKSINPRSSFIVFRNPVIKEMRRGNGCFIDLRTLAYVFTNQDYTLTEAAGVFGVTTQANEGGENLIDACRGEVKTSWELYKRLMEEAKKHPVRTPPNKWYSPGSLGKAYLRAMNVHTPTLQSEEYSPDEINGLAMASDYGGRAEMYLRNVTAPIALADFKSMYPTIAVLMHLWELLTAQCVRVEDATQETVTFLEHVTPAALFHPEAWEELRVLVCVVPDGDFLPIRGQFWQGENSNSLGWGYIHKDKETPREMYYMLPDIVTSIIETGKIPKIVKALRFIPEGRQENMHPVKFRDGVMIDPYRDDFFKVLVEARALAKNDVRLTVTDRERLDVEIKYTNNALAYGSTIELNPSETLVDVDVQAFSDHAFRAVALRFEQPGGFYFPVIGALITSGAHLMLALGIDAVREKGGLIAFDDTDSLAMVASHNGAIRALAYTDHCKRKMKIPVLSFQDVAEILDKFEALNPYDRKAIPGSILRLEPENGPAGDDLSFYDSQKFYDEIPGETGPDLFYYGVASKRYALFNKRGDYSALRWRSEAALGQWINPVFGEDETWIDLAWHIGMDGRGFDIPAFGDVPIMSKFSVTTAGDMQAIETYNREYAHGDYNKGIKPFEIMLHPLTDRWLAPLPKKDDDDHWNYKPALLVAPYDSDLQDSMSLPYINLYDPREPWEPSFLPMGGAFREDGQYVNFHPVERFANYLGVYFAHHDIKMDDAYGKPCAADTIGLLYHPEIVIDRVDYIGKEMPNPDRLDADIDIQDDDGEGVNVFTPDIYEGEILPVIRKAGVTKTAQASGVPAMRVTRYLLQSERPSALDLKALKKAAPKLDENYSVYQAEVLPWLYATPTRQVVRLTGFTSRYIRYLKSGEESPGKDMLEKLIIACRTPRKEKEWQDDLLPRFIKIPTPELIRLTGFSKQYINYFKNGKRQPGPETIEKLRVVIGEYENLTIVR